MFLQLGCSFLKSFGVTQDAGPVRIPQKRRRELRGASCQITMPGRQL
jgi:hypothetical protein